MSNTTTDDIVMMAINEKKEPSSEELEDFKALVKDWFKYDDQNRKLMIAIKERKVYQKELEKQMQRFMIDFGYNDLNTAHGRIKSNVREVKKPIKMKDIKEELCNNKDLTGPELYEKIFNSDRETYIKSSLHRVIPKVSLQL